MNPQRCQTWKEYWAAARGKSHDGKKIWDRTETMSREHQVLTSCPWSVRWLRARCSATEPPFTVASDRLTQSLQTQVLLTQTNHFSSSRSSYNVHHHTRGMCSFVPKGTKNKWYATTSCELYTCKSRAYFNCINSTVVLTNKWRDNVHCDGLSNCSSCQIFAVLAFCCWSLMSRNRLEHCITQQNQYGNLKK